MWQEHSELKSEANFVAIAVRNEMANGSTTQLFKLLLFLLILHSALAEIFFEERFEGNRNNLHPSLHLRLHCFRRFLILLIDCFRWMEEPLGFVGLEKERGKSRYLQAHSREMVWRSWWQRYSLFNSLILHVQHWLE